jgi:hypothetical protein
VESSYFDNIKSFAFKTQYSRPFLNRAYIEVKNKSYILGLINLYWYNIWRILISLTIFILRPSNINRDKFIGILKGTKFNMNYKNVVKTNWKDELEKEFSKYIEMSNN